MRLHLFSLVLSVSSSLLEYAPKLVSRQEQANTTQPILDGQVLEGSVTWGSSVYYAYIPANRSIQQLQLTLNACTQPVPLNRTPEVWAYAPDLRVHVADHSLPSARNNTDSARLSFGFANLTIETNSSLYIAIQAPTRNRTWSDDLFSFQIGLTTNEPLHGALIGERHRFLFIQDTDFGAALLTTGNLSTSELPNYQIWVVPSDEPAKDGIDAALQDSLHASYCGITTAKAQVTLANADRSMTLRGGGQPKEQFYVHGLKPSTSYDAYITLRNNFTEGGTVWPMQQFRTRDDTTCQVIYNLAFCNEIAYSVPSNSTLYNAVALGTYYDNRALAYFQNFSNTMQLYNCNATDSARYSLVSTCEDCKAAYKDWLCAVTLPRCADTTNPAPFLTLRNTSRSQVTDRDLKPGSYKEILPCGDLPKNVARTCPAPLQFWLPATQSAFDAVYGQRSGNATISCNAPGVDFWIARASHLSWDPWLGVSCIIFTALLIGVAN